jgi:hypothetical protein
MLLLRTREDWTGIKEVDGKPVEGLFRSYRSHELFDRNGTQALTSSKHVRPANAAKPTDRHWVHGLGVGCAADPDHAAQYGTQQFRRGPTFE